MNQEQEEGRNSVFRLRVKIDFLGGKYVGFVDSNWFYCLHVTQPYDTKIDVIYELTGFLTHLKNEADTYLNELFTEKCEILNDQKNSGK